MLVGLFAIAELLERASQRGVVQEYIKLNSVKLPTFADFRKCAKAISLSSVIGTFIGVLPALGATTAALICYNETKRWSKHKEEFGKGAIEGVAGPEAANNAAVGGAMVPTLALGIPGSTTTAIILAGLMVQGVRPGPHLFNEQPTLLYVVFGSMLVANLLYLVLGLGAAKIFARIALIPEAFLWPAVFILSVVGAYAPNQSMEDVVIMLFFGRRGISLPPLRVLARATDHGSGSGQDGGGDAEAIAADLRPGLDAVLRATGGGHVVPHHRCGPARAPAFTSAAPTTTRSCVKQRVNSQPRFFR